MQRKLMAILAGDVVGYSMLMGADEAATLASLKGVRQSVIDPTLAGHHGNIIKSMGDGWIVSFSSAVDAVNAAMHIQDSLRDHPTIKLRIGVHIGDVVEDEGDVFGDGVNIAARLEALSKPGGVMISEPTYSSLDGTISPSFDDGGERNLKNILRPMRVWIRGDEQAASRVPSNSGAAFKSQLPKILIHPITTSDSRSDVNDLSNAISSDLCSYLSSVAWMETLQIQTGIYPCFELRGVLRSSSNRLRLEMRLVSPVGDEITLYKSDALVGDSFDWQDQVVEEVSDQVVRSILDAETLKLSQIPESDLSSEQYLLLGLMAWHDISRQAFVRALEFQIQAIKANPELVQAYAEAIIITVAGLTIGFEDIMPKYQALLPSWMAAANKFDGQNPQLDLAVAVAEYMSDGQTAVLRQRVSTALRRAPFDGRILTYAGWAHNWSGNAREALECFEKGIRLNRYSPFGAGANGGAAVACCLLGQWQKAIRYAEEGLIVSETYSTLHKAMASAQAHLGNMSEARAAMARFLELVPEQTYSKAGSFNDYGGSEGGTMYREGWRLAGMPE